MLVHPNGTICRAGAHQQHRLEAWRRHPPRRPWRGPYRMVASDTFENWQGTPNAGDPFTRIETAWAPARAVRGRSRQAPTPTLWRAHVVQHLDGERWAQSSHSTSRRPTRSAASSQAENAPSSRPKLRRSQDGVTPTHIYGATNMRAPSPPRARACASASLRAALGQCLRDSDARRLGRGARPAFLTSHPRRGARPDTTLLHCTFSCIARDLLIEVAREGARRARR